MKAEAKGDLQQLEDELRKFKCFLEDSADEPEMTRVFNEELNQIRETVYNVEGIIDSFLTKAKTKNLKSKVLNILSTEMEEKVKSIRATDVKKALKSIKDLKANDNKRVEKL